MSARWLWEWAVWHSPFELAAHARGPYGESINFAGSKPISYRPARSILRRLHPTLNFFSNRVIIVDDNLKPRVERRVCVLLDAKFSSKSRYNR